jgi:hypothetical protein
MGNNLINLLRNEKLRGEVISYLINGCEDALATFRYEPDENDEEGKELMKNMDWQAAWDSISFRYESEKLFRKYFFDKISQPWPAQPEELTKTLEDMVCSKELAYKIADEEVEFETLYDVFLSYVENHYFSYRRSLPFAICKIRTKDTSFIKWFLIGRLEDEKERIKLATQEFNKEENKSEVLWTKNDISIVLELRLDRRGQYDAKEGVPFREDAYLINAIVTGNISHASLDKLYGQISRCLSSIIRSFSLLYPLEGRSYINFDNLPQVNETFFENNRALIKNCLELFFTEPIKKDTIDRRVRNAVHLLTESDNQSVDAIGLSLSMAAIEALLAQKGEGWDISEKLKRRISTLLEPDLSKREKVEMFVKTMYGLRSDALHGTKIDAELQARKNTRHLAAAALVAVLHRCDFLKRLGEEPETPEALLKELYDKTREPGQPMGVPELNVRSLWTE